MPRELIIESDYAYELAHELAERFGMTVTEVVELGGRAERPAELADTSDQSDNSRTK